jgi:hypothetical protein
MSPVTRIGKSAPTLPPAYKPRRALLLAKVLLALSVYCLSVWIAASLLLDSVLRVP